MSQDPGNDTFFHNYFLCLQLIGQPSQQPPQPRFFFFTIPIIAAAKAKTISATISISIQFIYTPVKSITIKCTMLATTHAITHCQTITPIDHFNPSSRLIEAIAATHGV